MSRVYEFYLPGITCVNCVKPVEQALEAHKKRYVDTDISYTTDIIAKSITITIDSELSDEEIIRVLKDTIEDTGVDCQLNKYELASNTLRDHWLKGGLGLLCGMTLLILSVTGVAIPVIAMFLITAFSICLVLYLGWESYSDAIQKLLKSKIVTMDVLFMVSTLIAIGVSIAALFVPGMPMLLDAALLIFGFRHIGKAIEASAKKAVSSGIRFHERAPRQVEVIVKGKKEFRKISEIEVGDHIVIPQQTTLSDGTQVKRVIPLDGKCLQNVEVYNTIITGQTSPQWVNKGELLLAGMEIANQDEVVLQVTATESDSYLRRTDAAIRNAQQAKAPIETRANDILAYFIPFIFVCAIISVLCVSICCTFASAIQCGIAVLVSACPCTLGIIVALAVMIGLAKAAACGALFKTGAALEMAEKIDEVVFDLNGTLTQGAPQVTGISVLGDDSEKEILAYFNALESHSTHSIAKAICAHAKSQLTEAEAAFIKVDKIEPNTTSGLRASIDGEIYTVGNQTLMKGYKNIPNVNAEHCIFLARGETIIAYITLHDSLREDAKAVVQGLQAMKITVRICSGASKETAMYHAGKLGISDDCVKFECITLPGAKSDAKSDYIKSLQAQGKKVAMVGDAGNDARAVNDSHLGIAIQSAAADRVTQSAAGVLIDGSSLMPVLSAFSIAKQTVNNIEQNLLISLLYNVLVLLMAGGLLITVGCTFNPGVGVALMILQMCLVLLLAYHFKESPIDVVQQGDASELQDNPSTALRHHPPANLPSYDKTNTVLTQLDYEKEGLRPATRLPDPVEIVGNWQTLTPTTPLSQAGEGRVFNF